MYNLKYTLYAIPNEKPNNWSLKIYCHTTEIEDWNESPRGQRYAEMNLNTIKVQNEIMKKEVESKGQVMVFAGFDLEVPKNAKIIMEENLKMTAHPRFTYPIFKRNGFQRYAFEKGWTGAIHFLQDFTQLLITNSRKMSKIINSRESLLKIEELERKTIEENKGLDENQIMLKLMEKFNESFFNKFI